MITTYSRSPANTVRIMRRRFCNCANKLFPAMHPSAEHVSANIVRSWRRNPVRNASTIPPNGAPMHKDPFSRIKISFHLIRGMQFLLYINSPNQRLLTAWRPVATLTSLYWPVALNIILKSGCDQHFITFSPNLAGWLGYPHAIIMDICDEHQHVEQNSSL